MNKFDLIIFDCDGVLVNSEPIVNRVFIDMIKEFGFALDYDETLKEFSGCSIANRIERIEKRLNWTVPVKFVDRFHSRLDRAVELDLKPVPGIREVVETLSTPRCLASNGSIREIQHRLRVAGLSDLFPSNLLFSALDVPRTKPAPDVFLYAAKAMHVEPARCAVIEDSLAGVHAAMAAKMTVFAYAGITSPQSLRELGATVFTSMEVLPSLLA